MTRQLNKSEIEKLFEFTRKKRVRYLDVQFEIVDHLASDIEEQMSTDDSLSFEKGLQNAYAKFPITGFAQFVQHKSDALSKYWRTHFFRYFIEFLSLPKIIISVFLFTCFFYLFRIQGSTAHAITYYSLIGGMAIYALLTYRKSVLNKKNREKYLFLSSYYGIVYWLIYFVTYLPFTSPDFIRFGMQMGSIQSMIWAILMTVYVIIVYACLRVFPNKLKEEINSKYQHLEFV